MTVISWQPPPCREQNGPITNYTLNYTDFNAWSSTLHSGIQELSVTLNVLPFRNMSFQVAAVTSVGIGKFSEPVFNHLIGSK